MTVKVYQIDNDTNEALYPNTTSAYSIGMFDPMEHLDKYKHVANVGVSDLDEAFRVGNIGPDYLIERRLPMRSVSVGDILEYNGTKYVVASFGFKQLEMQ